MQPPTFFNLAFYVDNPGNISGLSLAFAVGPEHSTLGSFTDYYSGALQTSASTPSLTTPTGVTLSSVTGIGILVPIQTYGYRVSAANATGETLASVETTITPKTVYGYCSIKISWSAVAGATYYKIYGRTPGGEQFIDSVPAALTTYTDMGNLPPNVLCPGRIPLLLVPDGISSRSVARPSTQLAKRGILVTPGRTCRPTK